MPLRSKIVAFLAVVVVLVLLIVPLQLFITPVSKPSNSIQENSQKSKSEVKAEQVLPEQVVNPGLKAGLPTAKARLKLELVGHISFDFDGDGLADPGKRSITDVWAFGNFAYVGTSDQPFCSGKGIRIVDISDPSKPVYVGSIESPANTRAYDVQVARIETKKFKGDVLVHTNEPCTTVESGGRGGVRIYDVTDPRNPIFLAEHYQFPVHNVFIHQYGNGAYVLIADVGPNPRLHILDISDPSNPIEASAVGVMELQIDAQLLGNDARVFVHDVWAKTFPSSHKNPNFAGKTVAYLAYWDAGLVVLDITDPRAPRFLGRSIYLDPDPLTRKAPEGNSHSAVPSDDGNLVLMGDEDLTPFSFGLSIDSGPYKGEEHTARGSFGVKPASLINGTLRGPTHHVGSGCEASNIEPALQVPAFRRAASGEKLFALMEQGGCFLEVKIKNARDKGYSAIVIFGDGQELIRSHHGEELESIPTLLVKKPAGLAIKELDGTEITVKAIFDGWGYLRILDVSNPAKITEVGRFAAENTFKNPPPIGNYTIHNLVVEGNLAFIAWDASGIRVVNFSDPKEPKEIAVFLAPDLFKDGKLIAHTDFWGVHLHVINGEKYVLASDRNFGLYILKFVS